MHNLPSIHRKGGLPGQAVGRRRLAGGWAFSRQPGYDQVVPEKRSSTAASYALPIDQCQLKPGLRLAIGLSGGADSVALTRVLAARAAELGLVLHLAHLHHGLRGAAADRDQAFCAALARTLGLPFHTHHVDTALESAKTEAKSKESIEEAARRLRYEWFCQLMAAGTIQAVATAHTLDDQAETVLGKFLRGAWTEGLSGIHPKVNLPEGQIIRPLLSTSRIEIEAYLRSIGQPWQEDESNLDLAYTRNRLRHQLLPELEQWNPRIRQHLSGMAQLARDEESWWQAEIARLAAQLILPGRPVRGGGRAVTHDSAIALDVIRLAAIPAAAQRRLLRHAGVSLGISLGFEATETLRNLVIAGRAGQRIALPGPITAERTARELRLSLEIANPASRDAPVEVELPIPGEAAAFGLFFRAESAVTTAAAMIRNWRAGDRVTLRYSSGPRKIKEVLERLKVTGTSRAEWPVVEWQNQVIWMQGAELQPIPGITISAQKE